MNRPDSFYEFDARANQRIARTAEWLKFFGLFQYAMGAIQLLEGFVGILPFGLSCALGFILLQASKSLQAVVDTEGDDIDHLMQALGGLDTLFLIRLVLLGLMLVFITGAVAVMVLVGIVSAG